MKSNLAIYNASDVAIWNQLFSQIEIQILTDAWNHVRCRTDLPMNGLYLSFGNKVIK